MNVKVLALAGAVALLASPALAIDIINEDAVPYEVMLDNGTEVKTVTINAGETLANACESCSVTVGESSLDAQGVAVVVIKDGVVNAQ
ncbi:hypothetical protein JCM17960_32590 [Magnetospira thiophila]